MIDFLLTAEYEKIYPQAAVFFAAHPTIKNCKKKYKVTLVIDIGNSNDKETSISY